MILRSRSHLLQDRRSLCHVLDEGAELGDEVHVIDRAGPAVKNGFGTHEVGEALRPAHGHVHEFRSTTSTEGP